MLARAHGERPRGRQGGCACGTTVAAEQDCQGEGEAQHGMDGRPLRRVRRDHGQPVAQLQAEAPASLSLHLFFFFYLFKCHA